MPSKSLHYLTNVRIIFIYLGSFILSVLASHAQDVDATHNAWKERWTLVNNTRSTFYRSAGTRAWQNQFSYSAIDVGCFDGKADIFLPQKGTGQKGFVVSSESYKNLKDSLTLWGRAFYNNKKVTSVLYNESLDYEIIYPYAMVDTVGGDLNNETYYFNGGVQKRWEKYSVAFDGSYTGGLAYRRRDPRQENTSSKVDFSLAVSRQVFGKYQIAVDLNGTKYQQRNSLDFASNLGAPNIFHDAGLGAFNDLLDGTNETAIFNGSAKGALLSIVPEDRHGFMFVMGIDQFKVKKRLDDIRSDIGELTNNKLYADLGYSFRSNRNTYILKLTGQISDRKSLEANFNNRGDDAGFVRISETNRFSHDLSMLGFEISGENRISDRPVSFMLKPHIVSDKFRYINPNRKLETSSAWLLAGINYMSSFKKSVLSTGLLFDVKKNLRSSTYWPDVNRDHTFSDMLNRMAAYYSSSYIGGGGVIRGDISVSDQLRVFGSVNALYRSYKDIPDAEGFHIQLSFGINF